MKKFIALAALVIIAACGEKPSAKEDSAAPTPTTGAAAPEPIETASASTEQEVSPEELGRISFNECAICHTVNEGDANRVGPNLFNIAGNEAGKVEGFAYSRAMAESGMIWTDENLDGFLENPQGFMRGNRMGYVG